MSKTYAEAVFEKYKNSNIEVEVYIGQSRGRQLYNEYELDKYTIIRGYIKDAIGDMLVVESKIYLNEIDFIKKDVCINGFSIHCITNVEKNVRHEEIFIKLLAKQPKIN
jgi:hypothetical protein